jgi:hypothetical protein
MEIDHRDTFSSFSPPEVKGTEMTKTQSYAGLLIFTVTSK